MAFFQRAAAGPGYLQRLTKLYSDTKQSYESLTSATNAKAALERTQSGNEIPASRDDQDVRDLRRDFQIQQDRLLAWGISWSESGEDAGSFREKGEKEAAHEKDIDHQIEKAGLGEVVASVMSQIKGLLDQSGRLQHPERYEAMARGTPIEALPKKEWSAHEVQTGRALLEQLTTCIDVLYSLSESRQHESGAGKEKEKEAKREKSRGLEDDVEEAFYGARREHSPTTMGPIPPELQQGQPQSWHHPLYVDFGQIDLESNGTFGKTAPPPPYNAEASPASRERKVGILRQTNQPVLVDFLTEDIPPYMIGTSDDVFELHELGEKLVKQRNALSWCGHLRLIGFTIAPNGPRCGMVYEMPMGVPHSTLAQHRTLEAALSLAHREGATQPNLEDRFKLAYNLIISVLGYFANGDNHGHVNSSNVLLVGKQATHLDRHNTDLRRPFFVQSCQDLVAGEDRDEPFTASIYRHPAHSLHQSEGVVPAYDIYSLGLMLLEVGLWIPVQNLWKPKYDRRIFMERVQRVYSPKLASKCGSKYMRLVQRCLHGPAELLGKDQPEEAGALLLEIAKELRLCCALDEDGMPPTSDLEVFELLIIEQMCKTEELKHGQLEPGTSLPPLRIPGSQEPQRQYSGTTRGGSDAVRRRPLPSEVIHVTQISQPDLQRKKSKSSHLKKWPELPIEQQDLDQWNTLLMPRLRKVLEEALHESPESCSVSLMKIGPTPDKAKTTICIQCQNTARVHQILKKRFMPKKGWGVVILKGDVHRSGARQPRRSAGRSKVARKPREHRYQTKPSSGASIGAFRDSEHLPPCSFGGTILVDGEPFGMTVHHMLDHPSDSEEEEEYSSEEEEENKPRRSAAQRSEQTQMEARIGTAADFRFMQRGPLASDIPDVDSDELDLSDDDDLLSLSDTESEASTIRPDYAITDDSGTEHWFLDDSSDTTTPSLIADDFSDDDDDPDFDDNASIGDKPAIEPYSLECEELRITQPALDDVDEDFFPSEEDRDEDHLASHAFGYVHASSGIRRVTRGMLTHEVDWALIKIEDKRLDLTNIMAASFSANQSPSRAGKPCKPSAPVEISAAAKQARDSMPNLTSITSATRMSGLEVACHARSSGFTHGKISQAMCLVKLHGRRSFSYSWCVDSTSHRGPQPQITPPHGPSTAHPQRSIAAFPSAMTKQIVTSSRSASRGILGIPGDSGAWVYNPSTGELAGHVLAYGETLKQAYIAPMEVLFEDIRATLGAARVELPCGAGVAIAQEEDSENLAVEDARREVQEGLRSLSVGTTSPTSTSTEGGGGGGRGKRGDVSVGVVPALPSLAVGGAGVVS